jgi:type II secretory pathway component HofQ
MKNKINRIEEDLAKHESDNKNNRKVVTHTDKELKELEIKNHEDELAKHEKELRKEKIKEVKNAVGDEKKAK